jgi:hypothetical protein
MSSIIIVRAIVQPQPSLQASAERRNTLKTTDVQATEPPQKLPLMNRVKAVIVEGRLLSGVKRRLKPLVVTVGKSALRRSWIKRSVLAVLNSSPELKNRLYRLVWKDIALSPRAMRIYTALSTAIPTHSATHSKGND